MIRKLNTILFCLLEERYINKLLKENKNNLLLEQKAKLLKDLLDAIRSGKLDPLEVQINVSKVVDVMPEDLLALALKTGKRGEDLALEFLKKHPEFKFKEYPEIENAFFRAVEDVEAQIAQLQKREPIKLEPKKPEDVEIEGNVLKKPKPEEVSTEKPTELRLTKDEPETGPEPFKFPREEKAPPKEEPTLPKEEKAPPKEEIAPPKEKPFEPPPAPVEKSEPKPEGKPLPKPDEAPDTLPKEEPEGAPEEEPAPETLPRRKAIPLPQQFPYPWPEPFPQALPLPRAEPAPKIPEKKEEPRGFGFSPVALPSLPIEKQMGSPGSEIPYDIDAILDKILGKYSTSLRIK